MIIIRHRVNTIAELKLVPNMYGVEVDIRPFGKKLILQHEPFVDGESFKTFLKNFSHKFIVLNIKSEGIENEVIELMDKYNINNYFLLDVSFPFIIKLIKDGISRIALRFSEYESIETCLKLKGRVEWIWADNFSKLPLNNSVIRKLKKYFKVCIVSPELVGRFNDIEKTKKSVQSYGIDAVCTKNIGAWK